MYRRITFSSINNLNFLHSSKLLIFADDFKLFLQIHSTNNVILLQMDLNILSDWYTINKLPLNIEKFKVIIFSRFRARLITFNNSFLIRVQEINDIRSHNSRWMIVNSASFIFFFYLLWVYGNSTCVKAFPHYIYVDIRYDDIRRNY
ncbi:Reverse transcriptase domain-containing protein [Aphis craccivora]|uniref:Reverse transcriptase domain-containing protein n=1 Tax=Aphis craccivora TaxID=307492 RepID=A0A6G0YKM5_APHCR|nr:Reverse transcriptase domain-containing protein [Aphis craccivora]